MKKVTDTKLKNASSIGKKVMQWAYWVLSGLKGLSVYYEIFINWWSVRPSNLPMNNTPSGESAGVNMVEKATKANERGIENRIIKR